MKKIILILILISSVYSIEMNTNIIKEKLDKQKCSKIELFSKNQLSSIIKSYVWGLPYDIEEILPAIAWQESCAGLYKLNMYDPSAGLYHAYLPSVMARHKTLKNNKFMRNKIAQMLVNDDLFAASEAISELRFWRNYYYLNKKKYKKYSLTDFIIMSYNRGTSWNKSRRNKRSALKYLKNVKYKIKKIKIFIKKYNINREIKKLYIKNSY